MGSVGKERASGALERLEEEVERTSVSLASPARRRKKERSRSTAQSSLSFFPGQ